MHEGAPHGAADASTCDGVEQPSQVEIPGSFGKTRYIGHPFSVIRTPVQAYYSGNGLFSFAFGWATGNETSFWTDEQGIEAVIGALMATLVGARVAHGDDGIPTRQEAPYDALTADDLPF